MRIPSEVFGVGEDDKFGLSKGSLCFGSVRSLVVLPRQGNNTKRTNVSRNIGIQPAEHNVASLELLGSAFLDHQSLGRFGYRNGLLPLHCLDVTLPS
jgi:hypothetical protein